MNKNNRITAFLNDIPITSKLILILLLCIFMPMVSINLIFLGRITDYISDRENKNFQISMDRCAGALDDMISSLTKISHSIAEDRTFYDVLGQRFNNSQEFYENYDTFLRDRLDRFITINDSIDYFYLYTNNYTIQTGGNYRHIDNIIRRSKWYMDSKISKKQLRLCQYMAEDLKGKIRKNLSIVRIMDKVGYNSTNYEQILRIDIKESAIKKIISQEKGFLDIYLLDPNNNIVYSTNDNAENSINKKLELNTSGTKNSVYHISDVFGESSIASWSLIGVEKYDKKGEAVFQSQLFVFVLTILSIIISSIIIWVILNSYNFRIRKLSKHIEKVGDQNFSLLEIDEGKDEIGRLIRKFNSMTLKIDTLINDAYKNELQKKDMELEMVKTELKYLQSQMDPHFLFNTLNAIMSVCVKRGYTEIIDVIKHLSKILRRLISWKDEMVSVSEELSFTEMYLKIEEFRFCENFKYSILVDENCLSIKIPKMSIQTLVENACIHGIQKISGMGIIIINVNSTGSDVRVSVKDNGVGFDQDQVDEIYDDCINNVSLSEKIGIRSVFKRLMLYYKENVTYEINSNEEGAEISFTIKNILLGEKNV